MDIELVRQCADDTLQPAIVERFTEAVGVESPLAVTVTIDGKFFLVPTPKTPTEAVDTIRQHVGKAIVRVGLTQFPAGVGAAEASQIDERLVDPCENIKLGTTLFAKIYRIVTNWYGGFMPEAFDDAVVTYRSGYFEGVCVRQGRSRTGCPNRRPTCPKLISVNQSRHRIQSRRTILTMPEPGSISAEFDKQGVLKIQRMTEVYLSRLR